MSETIERHKRVKGALRAEVSESIKQAYERGESIRSIADRLGRSYGFVHRVLSEAGVSFRSRGGANSGQFKATKPRKIGRVEAYEYGERLRQGKGPRKGSAGK